MNFNLLFAQELIHPPKISFNRNSGAVGFSYDVRIWGWSTNGKVAYSTEYEWSEINQFINFVILDLITDSVLFRLVMNSFFLEDGNYSEVRDEALYNLNRASILNAMQTHNIIKHNLINRQEEIFQFPFIRNNLTYDCHITNIVYKEDEYGENNISKYSVLVTAGNRRKIINNFNPPPFVNEVFVKGYFPSPFENRIMVTIAEMSTYQYGPREYRFMGCHLGVGFE